jgi:flagellar assembly protein FliH
MVDESIKNYQFQSFDGNEEQSRKVTPYVIQEFKSFNSVTKEVKAKVIKKESDFAHKNSFEISPIVKEHRGINKYKEDERKKEIETRVLDEVNSIQKKAYDEGFEAGREEAKKQFELEMQNQAKDRVLSFEKFVQDALEYKPYLIKEQKQEIVGLIKSITKWIILRELKDDELYIERLLEKMILELKSNSNLVIHTSPDLYQKMPEIINAIEESVGNLSNVRIEDDLNSTELGMIVESENGILSGELSEQFQILDQIFSGIDIDSEKDKG